MHCKIILNILYDLDVMIINSSEMLTVKKHSRYSKKQQHKWIDSNIDSRNTSTHFLLTL